MSLPELQLIRRELDILKQDQDEAMAVAIYAGMSRVQAEEFDTRRKRVNDLYELLLTFAQQRAVRTLPGNG